MKLDYFSHLISRYSRKGVLLDSSLLLLFFVGLYDRERIGTFKRTYSQGFTVDDFKLLCRLLDFFDTIITTPNILTEVSNLSNQLRNDEKDSYYVVFANQAVLLTERYTESRRICVLEHFNRYGLTDSATIRCARGNFLVVTNDAPIVGSLQSLGIDVINFNHLKAMGFEN